MMFYNVCVCVCVREREREREGGGGEWVCGWVVVAVLDGFFEWVWRRCLCFQSFT